MRWGFRAIMMVCMDLGSLIETYGYWALAVGCQLEGETFLVLAGFAAHRGYLNPFAVVAVAAAAVFFGNEFFFWLGRRYGNAVIARWPLVAAQNERLQGLIARHDAAVIIGIRFAYGIRIAGPVLIGMSSVSSYRFALLNALSAVLWACLIAEIGWVFGQAAESMLVDARSLQGFLLLVLVGAGIVVWWIGSRRRR